MDKKSLGQLISNMRDRDKVRLFDKETQKEYCIRGYMYSFNAMKDQHRVDLSIVEVKHGKLRETGSNGS